MSIWDVLLWLVAAACWVRPVWLMVDIAKALRVGYWYKHGPFVEPKPDYVLAWEQKQDREQAARWAKYLEREARRHPAGGS